ncbi:MAG: hypothetical protein IJH39_11570 [Clostridia bacterium]|nr:hypothetical protein [Clostridia bacterium]
MANFFKDIVTLFLFNEKTQEFDSFVLEKVYFRFSESTRMTENGLIRTSQGNIIIPNKYAKINGIKAIDKYDKDNVLSSVLEGMLKRKKWNLKDKSFVVEGNVNDIEYTELLKNFRVFRITSVADNRKGGLQHLKLGVEE